jgi:hypothetical protein
MGAFMLAGASTTYVLVVRGQAVSRGSLATDRLSPFSITRGQPGDHQRPLGDRIRCAVAFLSTVCAIKRVKSSRSVPDDAFFSDSTSLRATPKNER